MSKLELILQYQELRWIEAPKMLLKYKGSLSWRKVAKELNCSHTYLYKVAKGQELISDEVLIKLIQLTGE